MDENQLSEKTKKNKSWLMPVILVVLVVADLLIYLVPKGLRQYQAVQDEKFTETLKITKLEEMPAGMPVDSFYDYDHSENKAMFTIESVDVGKKT